MTMNYTLHTCRKASRWFQEWWPNFSVVDELLGYAWALQQINRVMEFKHVKPHQQQNFQTKKKTHPNPTTANSPHWSQGSSSRIQQYHCQTLHPTATNPTPWSQMVKGLVSVWKRVTYKQTRLFANTLLDIFCKVILARNIPRSLEIHIKVLGIICPSTRGRVPPKYII